MDPLEQAIQSAGARMIERLEILRGISQSKEWLERILFSPAAEKAAHQLRQWMESAGMEVTYDALTNLSGHLALSEKGPEAPCIHVGSHYDTVINAGAYDGALGVVMAIAIAEVVGAKVVPFKHNLAAHAFCDEEGVRFNTTFLGSAHLSGQFEKMWLEKADERGKTLGEWLVDRAESIDELLGAEPVIRSKDYFLEAHIEQGPELEAADCALGVFNRIAAQMRSEVTVIGCAGHAGTTPASLRKDALPVASEMVLEVSKLCKSDERIRATVGHMEVSPNASNVIPGQVKFSIDLRYPDAAGLERAHDQLSGRLEAIAVQSGLVYEYRVVHQAADVELDAGITDLLLQSCEEQQGASMGMFSGAGHDSMKIARVCSVGMLACVVAVV